MHLLIMAAKVREADIREQEKERERERREE